MSDPLPDFEFEAPPHPYVPPAAVAPASNSGAAHVETLEDLTIVPLDAFVAVEEEGASALVGTSDAALIPEGGDVMFYGDGGAGKTSLAIDLACPLAQVTSGSGAGRQARPGAAHRERRAAAALPREAGP